ncbi:putative periplasmic binding protein [Desulfosarcina variabilis str. Montpellier]|uniref:ABC transporter substrate-binding protein n=1 Tax=Desulfosarcina variabilis TaxID=2300 RepID=UPI003AFA2671
MASEVCQDAQTVVDGAGRTVQICPSATLIVLITSQEIFRLLGVEERVVAVHRWVKALHPEENPVMAGKPIVGGFSAGDVNYEKIVEIASQTPGEDVVITYESPWADNIENHLDGMDGIKTLKLSINKMEHFTQQCRLLVTVVGREKAWLEYDSWRKKILRFLQARLEKVATAKKPRVYYNTSAKGHYDTVNAAHFVAKMINMAGGDNIGDALPAGGNQISPEWLLS